MEAPSLPARPVHRWLDVMKLSLSTRWNAYRHIEGESMIDEILGLGFDQVELGYDLRLSLVPGVKANVENGSVQVGSVHNYCPVPTAAPHGHPELFSLCSRNERERTSGVQHTIRTITFAAEMGAKVVVVHAGNVQMKRGTPKLIDLAEQNQQSGTKFEKIQLKTLMRREKRVGKHLDQLYRSLEEMLPELEQSGVILAMENLPSWESVPTEIEMETILNKMDSPLIRYWHDIGHGQVRQNLGFINHLGLLEKLTPYLAGMHIHDVIAPAVDHLMPPKGALQFEGFKPAAEAAMVRVMEPVPGTPADDVVLGRECIQKAWS